LTRLLLFVLLVLTIAAAFSLWSRAAEGASDTCAAEYYELAGDLAAMQSMHRRWALWLDAHPEAVAYNNVGSAADQWRWVGLYDLRLTAVWYLAGGDRAYVPWLVQHFEESRAWHLAEAAWLAANPAHPLNATADGVEGQMALARGYEWRLLMVHRMMSDC
jgi:hypothetical protein